MIDLLAPTATLFLCYNGKREDEILRAFAPRPLERVQTLGYESVKLTTQQHIVLFGPKDGRGEN